MLLQLVRYQEPETAKGCQEYDGLDVIQSAARVTNCIEGI